MARKPSRSLRRRTERRPERRTIVVLCEGERSEPDYVAALKRLPQVRANRAVTVEIHPRRGVPHELVEIALGLRSDEVDEIWCVFDVEWPVNHPHLNRALAHARVHRIGTAVSNPCFELWLLLHHGAENAFLTTAEADRKRRRLDQRSDKGIDGDWYVARRAVAVERAAALADRHRREGTSFPKDNPSSSMEGLVRALDPTARPDRS